MYVHIYYKKCLHNFLSANRVHCSKHVYMYMYALIYTWYMHIPYLGCLHVLLSAHWRSVGLLHAGWLCAIRMCTHKHENTLMNVCTRVSCPRSRETQSNDKKNHAFNEDSAGAGINHN
jgi:hypothetical protein